MLIPTMTLMNSRSFKDLPQKLHQTLLHVDPKNTALRKNWSPFNACTDSLVNFGFPRTIHLPQWLPCSTRSSQERHYLLLIHEGTDIPTTSTGCQTGIPHNPESFICIKRLGVLPVTTFICDQGHRVVSQDFISCIFSQALESCL